MFFMVVDGFWGFRMSALAKRGVIFHHVSLSLIHPISESFAVGLII